MAVTLRQQSNETKKDMAQHCKDLGCRGDFADNSTVSMNTCLSDCSIRNSTLNNCTEAAPDHCSNVTEVACGEFSNNEQISIRAMLIAVTELFDIGYCLFLSVAGGAVDWRQGQMCRSSGAV